MVQEKSLYQDINERLAKSIINKERKNESSISSYIIKRKRFSGCYFYGLEMQ